MPRKLDLSGKRYGRLIAIRESDKKSKSGHIMWVCQCDCGNKKIVSSTHLVNGAIRSCGCLLRETTIERNHQEKVKHGMKNTKIYAVWNGMKQRTMNPNSKQYKNYGARGITICDEWRDSFESFYKWSCENGYEENLTIERVNVNGNYEPSNCKWATKKEQANNRRSNRIIEYQGKKLTVSQWADELGIPYARLEKRFEKGYSIEKALSTKMY